MFSHHLSGLFFTWAGVVALFVNAASYIPQAIKLYKQKSSKEISLTMFFVFFVTLLLLVLYGLHKRDNVLIVGYTLSVIACGFVIFLAVLYRKSDKNQRMLGLKSTETVVEQRLKILENIVSLMPGHVYWVDRNNVYQGCNNEQAESAGLSLWRDIVGKRNRDLPWNIGSGVLSKKLDEVNESVMKSGEPSIVEEPATFKDGTKGFFLSSKVPLFDDGYKVVGMVGISVDITERKKSEEATKLAKEKAEAADQAKTNFIRDMGHDFRTPLTFIQGLAMMIQYADEESETVKQLDETINLIDQQDSDSELAKKLKALKNKLGSERNERIENSLSIYTSCNRVLEFFKEILDYAQSASGTLTNDAVKTNIPELLKSLDEMYGPGVKNKGIRFDVKISDKTPRELMLDQAKLKRILMNLIGNSIKFTDEGSITLSADYDNTNNNEEMLKVMIIDTAGGIPKDKLETIFGSFTQLKPADRGRGGYGLGLSIVKNYLNIMGGKIDVESELGKGSCFTISVPVKSS